MFMALEVEPQTFWCWMHLPNHSAIFSCVHGLRNQPRAFDFESRALTTQPCSPMFMALEIESKTFWFWVQLPNRSAMFSLIHCFSYFALKVVNVERFQHPSVHYFSHVPGLECHSENVCCHTRKVIKNVPQHKWSSCTKWTAESAQSWGTLG